MNPSQPTLTLRDIHLPDPVSWWPLAPGWWIVLALVIITTTVTVISLQRYRRRHYRRLGLQQLAAIELSAATHSDQQLIQQLSQLLRHMAVLHYGPHSAGLDGNNWLTFLDQSFEKKGAPTQPPHQPFSQGIGHCLAAGPYQKAITNIDTAALLTLCRLWIKRLPLPKKQRRCA